MVLLTLPEKGIREHKACAVNLVANTTNLISRQIPLLLQEGPNGSYNGRQGPYISVIQSVDIIYVDLSLTDTHRYDKDYEGKSQTEVS